MLALHNEGIFLGIVVAESKGKQFFNASVMVEEQAITLPTTEEVYRLFQEGKVKKFSKYFFTFLFNTTYRSLRLTDVQGIA